jgi:7-cyano-7-deazaguanine synthase in queuosine biosynthesis
MRFQVRTDPEQSVGPGVDMLLDWFPSERGRSTVQYEPAFLSGLSPSPVAMDLLLLGGAVFCADKLALRVDAADLWTRDLELQLPVSAVDLWSAASDRLHETLSFLSGDRWRVDFVEREVPVADTQETLKGAEDEVVSLFSGGLDSLAGVIEILEAPGRVVLVGHHDSSLTDNRQTALFARLSGHYGSDRVTQRRLLLRPAAANATQHRPLPEQEREDTTRARSFLFIAAGLAIADALGPNTALYIPENGFIGVNVPLTDARAGSLSTRTTHPFFMDRMRVLLNELGLRHPLENGFRLLTKGEAVERSPNRDLLVSLAPETISCSHPEYARLRHLDQGNCGYCYPCLIRRASLHRIGEDRTSDYTWDALTDANFLRRDWESGASLRALLTSLGAVERPRDVLRNGRIPNGETRAFYDMYRRGRAELRSWLMAGGAPRLLGRLR